MPGKHYSGAGKTSKGNQRYKCKGCGKTFTRGSEKRKSHPQARTYDNGELFRQLVNQTGINRAMEVTGQSPRAIYKKIDMFYERCLYFLAT
ncbi:MAG: IS1/IS1595 family N-terminal zinc-binding domain-containing protein [Neptuniibacter sp.]